MNIKEAAQEWNVSIKTVLNYIEKKYIIGISVNDDEIIIPQIPKPHVKRKPKKIRDIDKYICDTLNYGRYTNYRIVGVKKEIFEERLIELTKAELIVQKNPSNPEHETTLNYTLAATDKRSPVVMPTISPTVEIKIADQIGFGNAKIANI